MKDLKLNFNDWLSNDKIWIFTKLVKLDLSVGHLIDLVGIVMTRYLLT